MRLKVSVVRMVGREVLARRYDDAQPCRARSLTLELCGGFCYPQGAVPGQR
jgi:hypothetical protein